MASSAAAACCAAWSRAFASKRSCSRGSTRLAPIAAPGSLHATLTRNISRWCSTARPSSSFFSTARSSVRIQSKKVRSSSSQYNCRRTSCRESGIGPWCAAESVHDAEAMRCALPSGSGSLAWPRPCPARWRCEWRLPEPGDARQRRCPAPPLPSKCLPDHRRRPLSHSPGWQCAPQSGRSMTAPFASILRQEVVRSAREGSVCLASLSRLQTPATPLSCLISCSFRAISISVRCLLS